MLAIQASWINIMPLCFAILASLPNFVALFSHRYTFEVPTKQYRLFFFILAAEVILYFLHAFLLIVLSVRVGQLRCVRLKDERGGQL